MRCTEGGSESTEKLRKHNEQIKNAKTVRSKFSSRGVFSPNQIIVSNFWFSLGFWEVLEVLKKISSKDQLKCPPLVPSYDTKTEKVRDC